MAPVSFADRLRAQIAAAGNALCVGIDPPILSKGGFFHRELQRSGQGAFLNHFSTTMIEAAVGLAPAIKLQSAFFEACGSEGFDALIRAARLAKDRGFLTILDAKRGDISTTMAAYGRMAFEVVGADALTVTPYMGFDVVEPLCPWLSQGHGVYLVWISSNPSGSSIQEQKIASSHRPLADVLLEVFANAFAERSLPHAYGLVLGATKLECLSSDLRQRVSTLPLLMPGIGAQGGNVTPDLLRVISASGATLVPMSRALSDVAVGEPQPQSWEIYAAGVQRRIASAAGGVSLFL